ncbi:MAG: hypothetical protein M3298_05690 [Thermoproteota archaeon]|nr:hypothetical protein [Thermoproteota archaeon]
MSSEESKLVTILKRNPQGVLERVEDYVYVNSNDVITIIPTNEGLVAVIGSPYDEDEPVLERLLKDL